MKCPECKSTLIFWHPTTIIVTSLTRMKIAFMQRNERKSIFDLRIGLDEIKAQEGLALFSCGDCSLEFEA